MKDRILGDLEVHYDKEDKRLQGVVYELREDICNTDPGTVSQLEAEGSEALLFFSQKYGLKAPSEGDLFYNYELVVTRTTTLRHLLFLAGAEK